MDKIKFKNGSEIKIIDVDVASTRSKRGHRQLQKIKYYYKHRQLQKIKDYYKHNPDKYVEEVLGIKLFPYQRIALKLMLAKKRYYLDLDSEGDRSYD